MASPMASDTPFLDAYVAHGLGATEDMLTPAATSALAIFLLDSLGVGIAGASAPLTRSIRTLARLWSGGDMARSGTSLGPCRVWGHGSFALPQAQAAFVNAFQIHCQEYDCVHEPAVVHPMATILAALISEAEVQSAANTPISGRALRMALVIAVDLAAGIGISVDSPIQFFRPANAGIFGATLGISRLRGFDDAQTRDALGYALAFNAGTMQAHVEGKPTLPVQIAHAARCAVMACDAAQVGLPGPHGALDGPYGYFALFEKQANPTRTLDALGKRWRITEISHKPFPTGRAAQGGITLVQKLRDLGVTADNVQHITLAAPPIIQRLVGRSLRMDMDANYARLCFQYSGAVALLRGTVGLRDFSSAELKNPAVHAVGQRISITRDGSENPAAFAPQTITAKLKNGDIHTARLDALYGSPAAPMPNTEHLAKFADAVDFGFGATRKDIRQRLIQAVDNLDSLADSAQLAKLASGEMRGEMD